MCGGSLGGKARGLAFAKDMIVQSGINDNYENIVIKIPRTAIIGTEEFDRFMKDNNLWDDALKVESNEKRGNFLKADYPWILLSRLKLLKNVRNLSCKISTYLKIHNIKLYLELIQHLCFLMIRKYLKIE